MSEKIDPRSQGQQTGGVRLSLSSSFCAGGFRSGGWRGQRNWLLSWGGTGLPLPPPLQAVNQCGVFLSPVPHQMEAQGTRREHSETRGCHLGF